MDALKFVYEMFKNDKDFPVAAIKNIGERVCVPIFRECSSDVLLKFFVLKISDVMNLMEAKLARVSIYSFLCYCHSAHSLPPLSLSLPPLSLSLGDRS